LNLFVGVLHSGTDNPIVLLGLDEVEIELEALSILLFGHVNLPVVDPFLMPLLHKTCIAVQFVDLDTAQLLFLLYYFLVLFVQLKSQLRLKSLIVTELL